MFAMHKTRLLQWCSPKDRKITNLRNETHLRDKARELWEPWSRLSSSCPQYMTQIPGLESWIPKVIFSSMHMKHTDRVCSKIKQTHSHAHAFEHFGVIIDNKQIVEHKQVFHSERKKNLSLKYRLSSMTNGIKGWKEEVLVIWDAAINFGGLFSQNNHKWGRYNGIRWGWTTLQPLSLPVPLTQVLQCYLLQIKNMTIHIRLQDVKGPITLLVIHPTSGPIITKKGSNEEMMGI